MHNLGWFLWFFGWRSFKNPRRLLHHIVAFPNQSWYVILIEYIFFYGCSRLYKGFLALVKITLLTSYINFEALGSNVHSEILNFVQKLCQGSYRLRRAEDLCWNDSLLLLLLDLWLKRRLYLRLRWQGDVGRLRLLFGCGRCMGLIIARKISRCLASFSHLRTFRPTFLFIIFQCSVRWVLLRNVTLQVRLMLLRLPSRTFTSF